MIKYLSALVIREIWIKPQWDTMNLLELKTYCNIVWLTNVDKNVEQLEYSQPADGSMQ